MSKKHDITYKYFQRLIKDKDTAVNFFVDNYLDKCQSMFVYENLPETIPEKELEKLLQENGNCFITEVDGNLYALDGASGGEQDAYYRPTLYTVSNPYLNISKSFKIGIDGVLFKNDYKEMGLVPLIGKYAVLLTDSELTLNTAAILSRITFLISASDDKTKQSATEFINKILDGDYTVIGENSFFDGVKIQQGTNSNNAYLTQLVELVQYYKATFLNEIGLNANFNMKRERLSTSEIAMNVDVLLPFVDDMFNERQIAIEAINKMFNTNIKCDFSSVWKTTHEESEKETETAAIEINSSQLENEDVDGETVETTVTTENEVDNEAVNETSEIEETNETDETENKENETIETDESETETETETDETDEKKEDKENEV